MGKQHLTSLLPYFKEGITMQEIIESIAKSLYSDDCPQKEHSRIYKIHKYWARKPWYIVEKYIAQYSNTGDTIMDPFCGSGCTGLEAVINGRNFKGQDLNPMALLVSKGTLLNNIDWTSFNQDVEMITTKCREKILRLYQSEHTCKHCNNQMYFKYVNIGPKFEKPSGGVYCCKCKSKTIKRDLTESEIEAMHKQNELFIENWVPDTLFPKKFYKDRFSYKGISAVKDMYTTRNLYALSILYSAIQNSSESNRELLTLAFTNTVLHASKLKGENVRPLGVNNYWIPDDYIEENVWFRFEDRLKNVIKAKQQQDKRIKDKKKLGIDYGNWSLEKKSALEYMGNECIDYFFTDPPYGDAIQYSELSFVWNAWLQTEYETKEEIIINPVQNKSAKEFEHLLSKSLDNIYTALKPNGYLTLCFQNKNSAIWKAVITHCKQIGFKLYDISIYDTYGSPFNKSWANFSPKSDIYVTFKKSQYDVASTYSANETVPDIIREVATYFEAHDIDYDNNKLYDFVISYLIWAMYLNDREINVKDFTIKKFSELANDILSNSIENNF